MRTTVDLKEDAYKIVKAVAHDKGITMGEFLSDLVLNRYADAAPEEEYTAAGFLKIRTDRPITQEDIKNLEEEEDEQRLLSSGWKRLDRAG